MLPANTFWYYMEERENINRLKNANFGAFSKCIKKLNVFRLVASTADAIRQYAFRDYLQVQK